MIHRIFSAAVTFAFTSATLGCAPAAAPISQSPSDPSNPNAASGVSAAPTTPSTSNAPTRVDHSGHSMGNASPAGSSSDAGIATVYACPMHPEVTSSQPGTCPKCNMKLVPKK